MNECNKIPLFERKNFIDSQIVVLKEAIMQSSMKEYVETIKITPTLQKKLYKDLLIFFVTSSLALNAVENPFLHSFINSLSPSFTFPSRKVLSETMLTEKYMTMKSDLYEKMKESK